MELPTETAEGVATPANTNGNGVSGPTKLTKQQRKRRNKKQKKQAERSGTTASDDDNLPELSQSQSFSTNGDDTVDSQTGNKISRSRARKLRRQRQKQRQKQDSDRDEDGNDNVDETSKESENVPEVPKSPVATAENVELIEGPADLPIPETEVLDKVSSYDIQGEQEVPTDAARAHDSDVVTEESNHLGGELDTAKGGKNESSIVIPEKSSVAPPKAEVQSGSTGQKEQMAEKSSFAPPVAEVQSGSIEQKEQMAEKSAVATPVAEVQSGSIEQKEQAESKEASAAVPESSSKNSPHEGENVIDASKNVDDQAITARSIVQEQPQRGSEAPKSTKEIRTAQAYTDDDKKEMSDNKCDCAGCIIS